MIVRILGEGQYDVAEGELEHLNELDSVVESSVEAGDVTAFQAALVGLLDAVRDVGNPHDVDSIDESDLILPPSDASLEEVREMLGGDGLIPG
jgi:hypothetical protein